MESAAMMKRSALCVALLLLITSPVLAGPLNGDANAFFSGTTPFSNGSGLSGTVDWAVYNPGAFPYGGYLPTPGEVVYAYQVFSDPGSLLVSHLSVKVINPADNIGNFPLAGGTPPSSQGLGVTSADWFFNPEVAISDGLAFSSPFLPILLFGSVVDGGTSAFVIPLPSPGTVRVPEPATVTMVVLGLMAGVPVAVRRWRRR